LDENIKEWQKGERKYTLQPLEKWNLSEVKTLLVVPSTDRLIPKCHSTTNISFKGMYFRNIIFLKNPLN
jgi:hypothetical protein